MKHFPKKFCAYWYVCQEVDGKSIPVTTDQYHYASQCQEECDRLNHQGREIPAVPVKRDFRKTSTCMWLACADACDGCNRVEEYQKRIQAADIEISHELLNFK